MKVIINIIGGIVVAVLLALVLSSCYNEKKATAQVDKATLKFPVVVAKIARDRFPCITKSKDSTEYNKSKRLADSLFNIIDSIYNANAGSSESLKDMIGRLQLDSAAKANSAECDSIYESLYRFAASKEKESDDLRSAGKSLRNQVAQLQTTIINFKPVTEHILDEAEVFVQQKRAEVAEAKYAKEHEARMKFESRSKQYFLIMIILALIAAIMTYLYIRKR